MLSATPRKLLSPLSSTVPSPRAQRTAPSTVPRVCFPTDRCNTRWFAHDGTAVSLRCALSLALHRVAVSRTHSLCFAPLTLRCIGPSGPVKLAKASAKPAAAKKTAKKEESPAEAKKTTKATKATTKKAPAAKKTATKATTKKTAAAPKAAKATKSTKTTKAAAPKKAPAAKANTSKKAAPKKVSWSHRPLPSSSTNIC